MENEYGSNVTEFNSNVPVIKRINSIIDQINRARHIEDPAEMVRGLVALYKEIYVELNEKEEKVWDKLIKVIKTAQNIPGDVDSRMGNMGKGRILFDLDVVDLELRKLAKKHGFLSANKEDVRLAMLR